ncbi:MAG: extracellular solute-binding protein [Planctomycetaceae bacterium]|nr:extracellular solute-binding protein [Planctomycetaceae bacterium]
MLLLAGLLTCAGCPGQPPPPPPTASPFQGADVAVAVPAELRLGDYWSLQLDEWKAASGADCRLTDADPASPVPPEGAALAIFPLGRTPDLLAAGWLAPLTDDDALIDWDDSLRGLRNGVAKPGGEPGLIPLSCPILACYYRADLLEAVGRQPPKTWEEYHSLLADLSTWSNGLPALEPWSTEFRSTMLLARAAPYALHPDNVSMLLDLQSGAPLIGEAPFVQALDDGLAAIKQLDPRSLEMSPQDCCRAVLSGQAALAIGFPPTSADAPEQRSDPNTLVGTVRLPGASRIYDRSSSAWTPTADGSPSQVTVVGFTGYAVGASQGVDDTTRHAAWNLWTELRKPTGQDDLPFGVAVCRAGDVAAAARQPAGGFTASEWRRHVEETTAALQETRVLLELPLPEASRFRESLARRVTQAIEGTSTPAAALEQAAADWQSLIDELGDRRVVSVYRQCHGLSPE